MIHTNKLLIKFPTRGRPDKAISTLRLYDSWHNGDTPDIMVTIDDDDASMHDAAVQSALNDIPGVSVVSAPHKSKVEACNSFLELANWDVVLLASDDMIPVERGYDEMIRREMRDHYPGLDGVLWHNDGHRGDLLNTLCIVGRTYYDWFGYLYHPSYKSLWCDNEFTDVQKMLNRYRYISMPIIRHDHWCFSAREVDESDQKGAADNDADQATYNHRKARNFSLVHFGGQDWKTKRMMTDEDRRKLETAPLPGPPSIDREDSVVITKSCVRESPKIWHIRRRAPGDGGAAVVSRACDPDMPSPPKFVKDEKERVLDIMICTLENRTALFERLRDKLQSQIVGTGAGAMVRVLSECDDGTLTIGAKRNVLLARARAQYVCSIDDDDDVSDEYVKLILDALTPPDVDCVGFTGRIMVAVNEWKPFIHSLRFSGYEEDNIAFYRPPNHLNPIRRSIAVRYPYRDIDNGEDTDMAVRMLRDGALATERFIDDVPIYEYTPSGHWKGGGR